VKECHPDLVTARGDDQAIKTAALRFCELQEAYEALCDSLTT
jgi:curved DNA-binding protein CbpA